MALLLGQQPQRLFALRLSNTVINNSNTKWCRHSRVGGSTILKMTSKRNYMDVHQRPSHSRMFVHKPPSISAKNNNTNTTPPTWQQSLPEQQHVEVPFWMYLSRAIVAFSIVHVVKEYVADITLCEGPSMSPTIQPHGEIVLIDKWTIKHYGVHGNSWKGVDRLQYNQQKQSEKVAKETIPGASVGKNSTNTNNNDSIEEWYQPFVSISDLPPLSWKQIWQQIFSPLSVGDVVVIQHPHRQGTVCKRLLGLPGDQVLHKGLYTIPDGHVWIEGDYPPNSNDSRSYGAVPAALLVGRAVCRLWPLKRKDRQRLMLARGQRPKGVSGGSTVLPAGYQGQAIVKKL